jgi:hypothetical protein
MRPAPQLSQGDLGIADRLNWDVNWDSPSGYVPVEYVRPWDVEGWGSEDVVVTAPLKIDVAQKKFDERPIIPDRPGFREGQKDYEYMATEKEQRRERRAQARDLAEARGRSWRDTPLPMPVKEEKEIKYPRWQDQEREVVIKPLPGTGPRDPEVGPGKKYPFGRPSPNDPPGLIYSREPNEREVVIQPVPTPREKRGWGETRPGEMYIQVEGPGNPSWERRNPERGPQNWRDPRGFNTSATHSLRTPNEGRREGAMWDIFRSR